MTRSTHTRRRLPAALLTTALVLVLVSALAGPALGESASPAASSEGDKLVYRVGLTQDYEPAPDLAESWATSPDGLTWTFKIRSGMKWHDGVPLTAKDIAFTYNLILDTEHWSYIQYLVGVTSVTAPDDTTLVIKTKKPNTGMLALYIPILPEHVWKDVDPDKIENYRNIPIIGSGPFKMVEAKKSKWIKMVANPDYPAELGGPPKLDEVYLVISQNTDSMIQDYKSGVLDAGVDWPALNYKVLESTPGTTVVSSPAIGFHEIGFNCWDDPKSKGNPLLKDVAIRQAVHWAIDKEQINELAMGGYATPATSLISTVQGRWHYTVPEADLYSYNPEKAKQVLEDAGYTDTDGDGIRENAKGKKLEFRFCAMNEYPEDQAAAKLIVGWCEDVGIKLKYDPKDEGAFSDEAYDNGNDDMFIWSWRGDIDPGFMLSTFTAEQVLNWGDTNYVNPEYEKLYVQQAQALNPEDPSDPTARKAITDEMQKILYRDNPYILLWYNVNLQAFEPPDSSVVLAVTGSSCW